MWTKSKFLREVRTQIAAIDQRRKTDEPADEFASITYANEREYRDALLWLLGKPCDRDFKIESRNIGGVWRHTLMAGSLGYSAANPLITVETR